MDEEYPYFTIANHVGGSDITFYQDAFKDSLDEFKYWTVHELGHAMDIHSKGMAALRQAFRTGSHTDRATKKYKPIGTTTLYGQTSMREDWAESVAQTVYHPPSRGGTGIDNTREHGVREEAQ